jgi:nicotinate-nucleotide adenylyltransferase
MNSKKSNIALLGGAFNPPHLSHIQLAQFVLDNSDCDEVWLLPTYKHFFNKDMVSSEHRLEMCKIACKQYDRIKVFDYEIRYKIEGGTYYFFDRLNNDKEFENYNFSMIIGLDNAKLFDKWFNYKEVQKMTRFIVVPRKGIMEDNISWYLEKPHIYLNEGSIMEVSSTLIRININNPEILNYLNLDVYNYIIENKLYL